MNRIAAKFVVCFVIIFGVILVSISLVFGFLKLGEYIGRRFGDPGAVAFVLLMVSLVGAAIWTASGGLEQG